MLEKNTTLRFAKVVRSLRWKSDSSLTVWFTPLRDRFTHFFSKYSFNRYDVGVIVGGLALLVIAGYLLKGRRKGPEELERERRQWLNAIGRITDGNVVDVQELSNNGSNPAQMIIYQYDVAGVSYEASQDITYLRQSFNLHSCRLGIPTSVKYDPHNPGNSIVVSETWVGLRTG